MRYGYTPDGKMRYEAAKKMAGFHKMPDGKMMSDKEMVDPHKRPASHQRQRAKNKATNKKLTKLGGVAGMMGITRISPKFKNESEAEWILRVGKESLSGFEDVVNGIKKVAKKVRG
jgi:hypothetical protein